MIATQPEVTMISKTFYTNEGHTVHKTFKILSKVFSDQFSVIYHAIDLENQQQKITIKTINKPHILNKQKILCQINNHRRMNEHQNFVTLKNVYEDQNCIYIIMEAWGISLEEIIKRRKYLTEKEVRLIFCQMVNILEHLRKNNIGHQNIKLESLLVSQQTLKIKLIDFSESVCLQNVFTSNSFSSMGLSSNVASNSQLAKKQINPYFSYEEIVGGQSEHLTIYSKDIWALGVIIFVLLYGEHPFCSFGNASSSKIRNCSYQFPQFKERDFVSNVWKQLIKRIFVPKANRIKLSQLIQHPLKMEIEQNQVLNYDILVTPGFLNNCTFYNQFTCENDRRLNGYKQNKFAVRSIIKQFNNREFQSNLNKKSKKGIKNWLSGFKENCYNGQPFLKNKRAAYEDPPSILKEPLFLNKFHYAEQINCLGYVVNKSIGILFPDGCLIIGHDEDEYHYYNYQPIQSRIKNQGNKPKEDQQNYGTFININYFLKKPETKIDIQKQIISNYQQKRQKQSKACMRNSAQVRILKKEKVKKITLEITNRKHAIYKHFLKFYGKRVIKSDLSTWVQKVYKIDALWIFCFNNKVWQVNMGDGICLIDQYGFGWWIAMITQKNTKLKSKFEIERIKFARKIVHLINSQIQKDILGFMDSQTQDYQPNQEMLAIYSHLQRSHSNRFSRQLLFDESKIKIQDCDLIFQDQ